MIKQGKELKFISLIKRDGSGTIPVGTKWNKESSHPKTDDIRYLDNENFTLITLSLTKKTYIASGFNCWVVMLRNEQI